VPLVREELDGDRHLGGTVADLLVVGGPTHIRAMISGLSRKMGLPFVPGTAASAPLR